MTSEGRAYVPKAGAASWRRAAAVALRLLVVLPWLGCAAAVGSDRASPAPANAESLPERAAALCAHRRPGVLPPQPFTTDSCSLWPDGDWGGCCVEHDMAYWCGGPPDARRAADAALRACIGRDHGALLSTVSYLGVRFGGADWLPFPWRWGYGWEWLQAPP